MNEGIWGFVFGSTIGSALNAYAYRLVADNTPSFFTISSRSHCPSCKKNLAWYDLIPIFSWIMLQGKCRYCNASISYIYPVIELLASLTGYALALHYDNITGTILYSIVFSMLLIHIHTDARFMLLADHVSIMLGMSGFSILYCISPFESVISVSTGFITTGILAAAAYAISRYKQQESLGSGDLVLLPALCSTLFFDEIPTMLAGGSILGIIYFLYQALLQKEDTRIPLGAVLSLATYVILLLRLLFS